MKLSAVISIYQGTEFLTASRIHVMLHNSEPIKEDYRFKIFQNVFIKVKTFLTDEEAIDYLTKLHKDYNFKGF